MKAVFVNALLGASLLLAVTAGAADNMASNEGNTRTCDDFESCPDGWSLVASPSLVLCDQTCKWETCCSSDAATEVIQESEETERRLSGNATTTTIITTTTVYQAPGGNASNATDATTTTPPATTTTPVVTTTTTPPVITATTTTYIGTTSTPSAGLFVISGTLTLEVTGNVQTFINDPNVKAAFQEALATKAGVPKEWVDVVLSASRRLSSGKLRRLAAVTVSYSITLPAGTPETAVGQSADSIKNSLATMTAPEFQSAVVAKLAAKGVTGYSVQVTDLGPVGFAVVVPTTTTIGETTTATVPGTEDDDSFALTKAAFAPAHALALLAAVVAAMSM